MWSLKPFKSPPSKCPNCSHENVGFESHIITGVHILGHGICNSCGIKYYHNWPIGHGADFPLSFTKNGISKYSVKADQWMARPLIKAIRHNLKTTATINRIVRKKVSQALLLNCLDPCYGHVVWKLFNTDHYQHLIFPQAVVVLIPECCVWMVPEHVAEVWSVELSLQQLKLPIENLGLFIKEVSGNYDSLQLLPVFTHLDHQEINLHQFFGTKPFQLSQFSQTQPCITFIWREDRFWLRTRLEEWLSLVVIKLSIDWLKPWFLYRQFGAINKVSKQVIKELPNTVINIVGLGTWGTFSDRFEDLRKLTLTECLEKKWCQAYARSHLVIGVHGSSMLIPTALSGGFIELLPRHKIPFISEDILMKHPARYQTFLGRHLDMLTSRKTLSSHIISIFKDFPYLFNHTSASP